MAVLLLVGCNATDKDSATDTSVTALEQQDTQFPVTLTDALGKEITIEKAPEKIISLVPSNTEILFALGLDEQIVGVNDYDNYPEAVATKERVGGMEFNLEQIIALQPDLVLAHESRVYGMEEGITQLEAVGIDVFVVKNAVDFDETYTTIEQIGQLTGTMAKANELVTTIQTQLDEIQQKVAGLEPKSAFILVGTEPDIYAAGTGTYIDEMLQLIGVENAVQTEGWPMYSAEQFVASNANTILVTYESDMEAIMQNPAYAVMDAVQNGMVKLIDEDTTSRQGPRLAAGVESIAKAMYPEVFGE